MAQHKSMNQQRGHRHQNHHRHKHLRNPVGKLLHRSFLRLRVTHQLCHLCQRGVRPHPGGPHHQPARRIHGCPGDDTILRHFHRHRFAREHGLVHRRMALNHHAIGGDLLARLDDKHIPHRELADRNTVRGAVDKHRNILRAHVQQRPQRLGTAALCAGLKPPAQQQKHNHHAHGFQIDLVHALMRMRRQTHRHAHIIHACVAEEQGPHAPEKRG